MRRRKHNDFYLLSPKLFRKMQVNPPVFYCLDFSNRFHIDLVELSINIFTMISIYSNHGGQANE